MIIKIEQIILKLSNNLFTVDFVDSTIPKFECVFELKMSVKIFEKKKKKLCQGQGRAIPVKCGQ